MYKYILLSLLCVCTAAEGQTNVFGKTVWPLGQSPGFVSPDVVVGLAGTWWHPINVRGTTVNPINRNYTTGSTRQVDINKTGNVMTVTDNGAVQFTVTNNIISQIVGFGFCSWEAGNNFWVDDFSLNNFTDDFSATNSGNWTHSIEMEPLGPHTAPPGNITQALWDSAVQASHSRIQGGRLELCANTRSGMDFGKTYAKLNRPINGDFTMRFTFTKTQWAGHTLFIFTTMPSSVGPPPRTGSPGTPISRRPTSIVRLRRKFNPKTGQMELSNPVRFLTHRGSFNVLTHNQYGHKNHRVSLRSQRTER